MVSLDDVRKEERLAEQMERDAMGTQETQAQRLKAIHMRLVYNEEFSRSRFQAISAAYMAIRSSHDKGQRVPAHHQVPARG